AVPDYQIEEIEELNKSLENRKVIERFSDEVYNHFEFDEGGQNSIYDRPSDRLFIYYSGEDSAYFFNFEQYQNDFLDEEEGSSQWPVYEVMSEPQSPILGFEVKEARIGGDESTQSDGGTGSVYWVAPELPVWFDKLKGVTLPGYPLRRAETTYIEGIKMSFYVEVVDIRPIDPKELVLTPPKESELLPWDSLQEDELYLFGIETQEEEDG
ncbi:MAG TPA: hypothetical protein VK082_03450, partial [Paenalcaligenes sp.]|nr:hypothetical protein [Paenalcaligenes sp.]